MLGESYGGDYVDPESPRPDGFFGPRPPGGGAGNAGERRSEEQLRGFGGAYAPPPPPAPRMNLPGGFGLGTGQLHGSRGHSSGLVPPPVFPSAVPLQNLTKPPLDSRRPLIPRESNSDAQRSMDMAPNAHVPGPTPAEGLAQPTATQGDGWGMMHTMPPPAEDINHSQYSHEDLSHHSNRNTSFEGDYHVSESSKSIEPMEHHDAQRKPPPAIAKESPMKSLYAKGAENYDGNRRKVSLSSFLDAVATDRHQVDRTFLEMTSCTMRVVD